MRDTPLVPSIAHAMADTIRDLAHQHKDARDHALCIARIIERAHLAADEIVVLREASHDSIKRNKGAWAKGVNKVLDRILRLLEKREVALTAANKSAPVLKGPTIAPEVVPSPHIRRSYPGTRHPQRPPEFEHTLGWMGGHTCFGDPAHP